MRYPQGHKQQTRERILEAAGRVFRREGFHAAGVDAVMEEAGLTAGGFYAHFPSKEALLAEALAHSATGAARLQLGGLESRSGRDWVSGFLDRYLSPLHRRMVAEGCPIPALVSEVSRAGDGPRKTFEEIFRKMEASLESRLPDGPSERSGDRALAILALCVGGMTLARAIPDDALADRILAACRDFALEGVPEGTGSTSSARKSPPKASRKPKTPE